MPDHHLKGGIKKKKKERKKKVVEYLLYVYTVYQVKQVVPVSFLASLSVSSASPSCSSSKLRQINNYCIVHASLLYRYMHVVNLPSNFSSLWKWW